MDSIFPEIAVSISTRHSIRRLLNTGESCIKMLNKKGMIDELEAQTFVRRIEGQLKHLVFFPPSIPLPSKAQLFHEIEWMNTLDTETFNMLCSAAKPQLFNPNELILKQGEVSNYVFIVARGSVNVLVNVNGEEREIQHKGVGLTLGEISLLKGIPRSSTVRALTGVLTFKLPFAAMFRAMHHYPPLHISLWKFACFHIAENTLLSQCEFQSLTWLQLRKIVHQWKVVHIHDEEVATKDCENDGSEVAQTPVKHELKISEQIFAADTAMMLIHGICDEFDVGTIMPSREQENEYVYQPPILGDALDLYDEDKTETKDDVEPFDTSEHGGSGNIGSGLLRRFTKMPAKMLGGGEHHRGSSGHSSQTESPEGGSTASIAACTAAARKKSVMRFEHTVHKDLRSDASTSPLGRLEENGPSSSVKVSQKVSSGKKVRRNSLQFGRKSSLSKLVISEGENSSSPRPKPKRQHSSEMSQTLEKMYGKRKSIFGSHGGKRTHAHETTTENPTSNGRRRSSERIPQMKEPLGADQSLAMKRGSTGAGLATFNNYLNRSNNINGNVRNNGYRHSGIAGNAIAMPLRVINNMKRGRLSKMAVGVGGHVLKNANALPSHGRKNTSPELHQTMLNRGRLAGPAVMSASRRFEDTFTRFRAPCYLPPSPGRARFVHKGSVILLAPSDLEAVEDILDMAPMMLKNIHWMKGCKKESIDALADASEHVSYRPEDVMMMSGDLANDVYIIVSGIVKIVMEIDGISRVVASEGEGACIGELALLTNNKERRRGASVIAKTQVRVLTIGYDVLEKVMKNDSSLELALWRKASLITTENLVTDLDAFKPWTQKRLQDYLKTWVYKIVKDGEEAMAGPLALVTGSCQLVGGNDVPGKTVNAPKLFPDNGQKVMVAKKSRVLIPPDSEEWKNLMVAY